MKHVGKFSFFAWYLFYFSFRAVYFSLQLICKLGNSKPADLHHVSFGITLRTLKFLSCPFVGYN